jgi:hypothetical protein
MIFRTWIVVSVMWIVSLITVGLAAQRQAAPPVQPGLQPPTVTVSVISGNDIGFRVASWDRDVPVGEWVVRSPETGNQWVAPIVSQRVRPATLR